MRFDRTKIRLALIFGFEFLWFA